MVETRQMHVILDLASFVGTMQYVGGRQLPRDTRSEPLVERHLANLLVSAIGHGEGVAIGEVRTNRPDPPDVVVDYGGQSIGVEVTELLPSYRLEKDAIIRQLRRDTLAQLPIGPNTRDLVINVNCRDDYAKEFRPGRWVGPMLGKSLAAFLDGEVHGRGTIALSPKLAIAVSSVSYFRDENVPANPLILRKDEPLILFGAQCTPINPTADFPVMVAERLDRKCGHKVDRTTWLLLWSEHYSMEQFQLDIVTALRAYFAVRQSPYQRTFYFHYGAAKIYEVLSVNLAPAESPADN